MSALLDKDQVDTTKDADDQQQQDEEKEEE